MGIYTSFIEDIFILLAVFCVWRCLGEPIHRDRLI